MYEPHGTRYSIERLKALPADETISEDIYVQGTVTSTDACGNYSRKLFFQDESSAISILVDLGASNRLYPIGQKVSVQCKGLVLADINGVLCLCAGVSGSGLEKEADVIDNRTARSSVFAVDGGSCLEPAPVSLSMIASDRKYADCIVRLENVFFQTSSLPYANAGGSSEQYRTIYDGTGRSALLCTSDGSALAGETLPKGQGSITGILTYPGGTPVLMLRDGKDIDFDPSKEVAADDPDDRLSDLLITEYYEKNGAWYVEIFNVGTAGVKLSDYSLKADTRSDGNFTKSVTLDDRVLGPFGMAVYSNQAARASLSISVDGAWDPCRTNYSALDVEALELDGNSQIALYRGTERADILATTNKNAWAANKTLIRRRNICGHSKASDYTRADAGWITKVSGYCYNLGVHGYFDTDPDFDSPLPKELKSVLEVKSMPEGTIRTAVTVTGRVVSDREGANVPENCVYIQDDSNRGLKILFKEGQSHDYSVGDEIAVELQGARYESVHGLLQVSGCFVARSCNTGAAPVEISPVNASISQISSLQSMYISVSGIQADAASLGGKYTEEGVLLQDLFANSFYAKALDGSVISNMTVASGSGTICGIASVEDDRLFILPRNAGDLDGLSGARFEPIVAVPVSVAQMKKYAAGEISDDVRVTVNVISDADGGNMPEGVLFVQDETGAFRLRVKDGSAYAFGQPLIVVLKGAVLSTEDGYTVTPASSLSVVAIGSPDPSIQPEQAAYNRLDSFLDRLVTIADVQVDEAFRLARFSGDILFNTKGSDITVKTAATAAWNGAYIPTAKGSVTGLLCKENGSYVLYPRKGQDLAGLPENGTRLNGEKTVYFVPSDDPGADLFISETLIGDLDANGAPLASIARNKCNSKFVELYNPTGRNLDLHNYRVACIKYNNSVARSTIAYWQFPEGLELTPGRTVVFKYVSTALGTSNGSKMTNTIWPAGYTADQNLKDGVTVDTGAVPGVILCLDARDFSKTVANSVAAFPSFDGNDILVVQKTEDGGSTWTETDRLFSLPTKDDSFAGGVVYPFLSGYIRKPGSLGVAGNVADVQNADYTSLDNKRNHNDFDSVQCNPVKGGAGNWTATGIISGQDSFSDLGIHSFSVKRQ